LKQHISYADLHVHTTFSDGAFTPEEAVAFAREAGLCAISITDHDMTDGIEPAIARGGDCGVEIIPGIELSSEITNANGGHTELHILGYLIDWKNEEFQKTISLFRKARTQRAAIIIEKLALIGIKLDEARLKKIAGGGAIGRLHFAKVLVETGFAGSITDAFQRFLGHGKPAYAPKMALSPADAIRLILDTGGVPVLAHPLYVHSTNANIITELVELGLKGIETWHSKHPPAAVKKFADIAFELGILSTGGSDCHGSFANEPPMMGKIKIPYHTVVELKKCKSKIIEENLKKRG